MKALIATVTCGGGHLQAAAALEEAWKKLRPKDEVRRQDVLTYAPLLYRRVYSDGYVKLINHAPELYGRWFHKTDDPALMKRMTPLRRVSAKWIVRGFLRDLAVYKPDVVFCPHFLPLEALGSLPPTQRPFTVSVVTDFDVHALWMEPVVDLYCVAGERARARLLSRGVPPEKVVATGIPVSQRFLNTPPNARAQLGLPADGKIILFLSGGFGMGPVLETLISADRLPAPALFVVVAGKNEALRKKIARHKWKHPLRVLGFVSDMQNWMAAADLVVTKPGGLSSSESLALGRPLALVSPIPGQEEANADVLVEAGAAIAVPRLDDLPFRLEWALTPARLAILARRAKATGKPRAAEAVLKAAIKALK